MPCLLTALLRMHCMPAGRHAGTAHKALQGSQVCILMSSFAVTTRRWHWCAQQPSTAIAFDQICDAKTSWSAIAFKEAEKDVSEAYARNMLSEKVKPGQPCADSNPFLSTFTPFRKRPRGTGATKWNMAWLLGALLLLSSSLSCHALAEQRITSAYIRSSPSPMLPIDHARLVRTSDSPHQPEQVQLTLAGPGAVAVSWVTNPQVRFLSRLALPKLLLRLQRPQSWPVASPSWRSACRVTLLTSMPADGVAHDVQGAGCAMPALRSPACAARSCLNAACMHAVAAGRPRFCTGSGAAASRGQRAGGQEKEEEAAQGRARLRDIQGAGAEPGHVRGAAQQLRVHGGGQPDLLRRGEHHVVLLCSFPIVLDRDYT